MVETKTLTLTLEEVAPPIVGDPKFNFISYSTTEPREVFPAGTRWPTLTKEYKDGDTVKLVYRVKNTGEGPGRWTITVRDLDTGAIITTWTGELDVGYSFKSASTGATVGPMPAKDWRLSVTVTP